MTSIIVADVSRRSAADACAGERTLIAWTSSIVVRLAILVPAPFSRYVEEGSRTSAPDEKVGVIGLGKLERFERADLPGNRALGRQALNA